MMRKSFGFLIVTIFIIISCTSLFADQSAKDKTILILLALSPTQPAYQPILNGIRQKLQEKYGDGFDIHTEYFDIEYQIDSSSIEMKFARYNEKYKDIAIDLLIVVGRNGIDIIKKYAEDYLLKLPTISVDLDFSDFGYTSNIKLNEKTAIVGMKMNIDKMLNTALSVFPKTKSVFFISGTSKFDKFMLSIASVSAKKVSNRKFLFLTDLSMDGIIHMVNKFPENSLIFVPSFNSDYKHVNYHNPEAIRLISSNSNSPVFAYSDMGFGEGSVGGYILSFNKAGLKTGEFAVQVLNGVDPNSLEATQDDYYETVFDWRELKRWNIQYSKNIPPGSKIMFEEVSFFDQYKWIIGLVLLFIILQSMLIVSLIRLNKKQKVMTQKVIETENQYRKFVNEDRIRRLGQLTASLSHELNQPLTAILSNAQAGINFINSNNATPELLKQILQRIVDNDKRGASIIHTIRGMMKLENRPKEKTELNSLIEETVAVIRGEARKQSTNIFLHILNEPIYIFADRIQIQQVLLNFIFNASQSIERDGASNKTIDINQSFKEENVIISVRDYGRGIDESIKDVVFKPFVTSKIEGMGIGLAICRSIIEDHNGKIWAENKKDGGAEFSFSLKILKDE